MHDSSISTSKLIAGSLWAASVIAMMIAWGVWAAGYDSAALMIATTAVLSVGGAVVAQIRCYTLRLCGLLRAVDIGGVEDVSPVRPMR